MKEQRRQLELQMAGVVDLQEPQNAEDGLPSQGVNSPRTVITSLVCAGVPSFSPVFQTQLPDDSISNKHVTDFIQRNIEVH